MKVILILLLISGVWTIFEGIKLKANALALMSDFKAFEARVAAEENGTKILELGGESDHEDFQDLIRKVNFIDEDLHIMTAGFAVTFLSVVGLVVVAKKPGPNQSDPDKA